jgi:hypothetical protein
MEIRKKDENWNVAVPPAEDPRTAKCGMVGRAANARAVWWIYCSACPLQLPRKGYWFSKVHLTPEFVNLTFVRGRTVAFLLLTRCSCSSNYDGRLLLYGDSYCCEFSRSRSTVCERRLNGFSHWTDTELFAARLLRFELVTGTASVALRYTAKFWQCLVTERMI